MSYKRVMAKARKRDGIPLSSYTGSGDEAGGKDRDSHRIRRDDRRKHHARSSDSHRRNGSRDRHRDRGRDKVAETTG